MRFSNKHKEGAMRRVVAAVVVVAMLAFALGCADDKRMCFLDGECKVVEVEGFFTMDDKDPRVDYDPSIGNVVWSILLSGTVVVPVVLLGWYLWEPVQEKPPAEAPRT